MPGSSRPTKPSARAERTRGRLLAALREGSWTVDDLADRLGLTDNAVRFHLEPLEQAGTIEKNGVRPPGLGEPAGSSALNAARQAGHLPAHARVPIPTHV